MRLRYLQSGGNNPEILLHIASMEQDAITLAQTNGIVYTRHQKNQGELIYCTCSSFATLVISFPATIIINNIIVRYCCS